MSNATAEQRPRLRSFNNKRRNRQNYVQVTDFLLGGNIQDPLNLASIDPNEQNQKTPVCSPIPTPQYNKEIDILIPTDLSDPLKLNNDCEIKESSELCHSLNLLISPNKITNKRVILNKRKRTESDSIVNELKEDLINKRMKLDLKTIKSNLKDKSIPHKIVSPAVPQKSTLNSDIRYHHFNNTSSNSKQRTNVNSLSFHSNDNQTKQQQSNNQLINKSQTKLQLTKQSINKTKDCSTKKPFIFESNQNQFYYARGRKFNLKDQKFQYGNYNRYYGYRLINQNNQNQDLRLVNFKKEWFENKFVLDVGCNIGYVTCIIARDFKPAKIVGLDIDSELIKTAKRSIQNYLESKKDRITNSSNEFPVSLSICHGPLSENKKEINKDDLNKSLNKNPIKEDGEKEIKKKKDGNEEDHLVPNDNLNDQLTKNQFPNNVQFIAANYVLPNDELLSIQKQEYDCILCLSITKWIHLNFGDEGLYRLFKRVYLQLKPSGLFILEPQPFVSYQRKKALTETTLKNYNSIKFKPDQFKDYLLSKEIGFKSCETIEPTNNKKGFSRPIYIFYK